jgi:hypothetical protein
MIMVFFIKLDHDSKYNNKKKTNLIMFQGDYGIVGLEDFFLKNEKRVFNSKIISESVQVYQIEYEVY